MILTFSRMPRQMAATTPAIITFKAPNTAAPAPPPSPGVADNNPFFCHVGRFMGHS